MIVRSCFDGDQVVLGVEDQPAEDVGPRPPRVPVDVTDVELVVLAVAALGIMRRQFLADALFRPLVDVLGVEPLVEPLDERAEPDYLAGDRVAVLGQEGFEPRLIRSLCVDFFTSYYFYCLRYILS